MIAALRIAPRAALIWTMATSMALIAVAADSPKVERLVPAGGTRGTSVDVQIIGTIPAGQMEIWSSAGQLSLTWPADAEPLDKDEKSKSPPTARITIPADAHPGVHWLRFYNSAGASEPIPFLVGLLPESSEVEPNNHLSDASSVALPSTLNGVLEKTGDVDVFAIDVEQEATFVASLTAHALLASPMDGVLQLLDSRGVVVAHNDDDCGFDPLLSVDGLAAGKYYVRVFAFPATPNSTIQLAGGANFCYRLTMTTGAYAVSTLPVVPERNNCGFLELRGWNLNEGKRRLAKGNFQMERDCFVLAEGLALPLEIPVGDQLSLVESTDMPAELPLPCSVSGTILQPGETDTYTFAATKGQKVRWTVAARAHHSLLDPVFHLYSPEGKVLQEIDDRGREDYDAEAVFTFPADGLYRVTVGDRFEQGSFRHFYLLSCQTPVASFSASAATTTLKLAGEGDLDTVVAISRLDGYTGEIRVSLEGLPPGVSCAPVLSEGKGDSASKVTLKLQRTSAALPFAGVVRILCTGSVDGVERSRHALATIPQANVTTADLWLTVPPNE